MANLKPWPATDGSSDHGQRAGADSADDSGPPPFDEAAESAFRAEARERGEEILQRNGAIGAAEEMDNGPAPQLDDLVQRIPSEVRTTLDELFRARFIAVKRVPAKALKS